MSSFSLKLIAAEQHLINNDPVLRQVIEKFRPCKIKPHADFYGELVSSIVGQQLSEKAGGTIWRRVLEVFGGKMPTPEQLLLVDTEIIRSCGVSYQKIGYMKDLARHIIQGLLDLNHISKLSNQLIIDQLTAVKGIGNWSAHMFMIFSLGKLDILPTGDLGIRKAMMKLYDLSELPKPDVMEQVAELNNWAPYQSVASWYLWQSLDNNYVAK